MEEFQFNIDRKVTVWERQFFSKEAESLEEAKQKVLDEFNETGEIIDDNSEFDFLYETIEGLTREKNGGEVVLEIMYNGEPFYEE